MNLNQLWCKIIVERLLTLGIDQYYLCPGLRNTPLIWAIQQNPKTKYYVGFDERGQSYRALGAIQALKKPVVLVCTSGSALANFFPAMIEAFHSRRPLIVISADRPVDLMWAQDNQTCNQENIYGTFCEQSLNLPSPTNDIPLEALDQKLQHFFNSISERPAHLNIRFREPLLTLTEEATNYDLKTITHTSKKRESLDEVSREFLQQKILNSKRPLLVIGELFEEIELQEIKVPWISDVTSSVTSLLPSFDCLYTQKWIEEYDADLVIHLGGKLTSKFYYLWKQKKQIETVSLKTNHDLEDPSFAPQFSFTSKVMEDYYYLINLLNHCPIFKKPEFTISFGEKLNQYNFVNWYLNNKNENTQHVVANSSIVRSFDYFTDHLGNSYFNRGTSGIEGFMAMSLGIHEATKKPTQLVIGDVSFLHDLSSLALFHQNQEASDLRIYLVNNYGGAIFKSLPIAKFEQVLKVISTPHEMSFAKLAEQFNFKYYQVKSLEDLNEVPTPQGLEIVELLIDNNENEKILDKIRNYGTI